MIDKDETLAAAESVTSGLLQSAFASAQDASLFFQGGIGTYNPGQKVKHLYVEPIHATASNCVSQRIADQMALHVCSMFQSDWGVAVTGYAVPVPESDDKLFAYYAIAHKNKILKYGKLKSEVKDPSAVKMGYIENILKSLYTVIRSGSNK
jgi:nicotinamide-nucleotide amidase